MFLPSIAYADIYKCSKSGGYYFSSEPCHSGELIYKTKLPVEPPAPAVIAPQVRRIAVRRGSNGVFNMNGNIDGHSVGIIVDTGASKTTISGHVAYDLGIKSCPNVEITQTANGATGQCRITVSQLYFGGFEINDASVMVVPNMQSDVLLGNDYLSAFNVELHDGVMILSH
jgi:aspartyl protease family protein